MKDRIKIALIISGFISGLVIAQESQDTDQILHQETKAEVIHDDGSELDEKWDEFLSNRGWNDGANTNGVIFVEDKDLIISSSSKFTEVGVGQPGWVESRIAAFEQAELEAKAKIVEYLSETTQSERSLELLENALWSDGTVHEMQKINTAYEKLKMIANKTLDLAEVKLDEAITNLDPGYDLAQYKNQTPEDLKQTYQNVFNRKISSIATRVTVGITPVYNLEGLENGQHRVLVGVIWSPKLNRVAMSMFNNEYNTPVLDAGKPAAGYISEDVNSLIGTLGTRIIVDENGQFAVLAYAQAQPRKTSKSREASAIQEAKSISADRARGLITNFVREGIASQSSEVSEEIAAEYSDSSSGVNIVREYRNRVVSRNDKIKIRGLSPIKQWHSKHPVTGQTVVGTVMLWSPKNVTASEKMSKTMSKTKEKEQTQVQAKDAEKQPTSVELLESLEVDTSVY